MNPSVNGGQPYTVVLSAQIRDKIKELAEQAIKQGRGSSFAIAMQKISDDLNHRPNATGEPIYRLTTMQLQVRSVSVAPVVVHFAVGVNQRVVYVKDVALMS